MPGRSSTATACSVPRSRARRRELRGAGRRIAARQRLRASAIDANATLGLRQLLVFGHDEEVAVIRVRGGEQLELEVAQASSAAWARELQPRLIPASPRATPP